MTKILFGHVEYTLINKQITYQESLVFSTFLNIIIYYILLYYDSLNNNARTILR